MATFGDVAAEITGRLPGLSPILAETFVTKAWRTIRDERLWAFLTTDGVVICPAQIAAGTANFTQFALTATMSAAAVAAIAAGVPNPPGISALQIRFMGTGQTGQIYNIVSLVGSLLTVDRAIQEPTNPASSYLIYRVYITPPIADFLAWQSLTDLVNGFTITKNKLTYTSAYFDTRDPQRQALGLAYFLGLYKGSSAVSSVNSTMIYELWPGATQGQTFYARFRRRGTDPAMTDPVPDTIPQALVTELALLEHVYPHMAVNAGSFQRYAKLDWRELVDASRKAYAHHRNLAKIRDNEQAEQQVLNRGHGLRQPFGPVGFPYPIDTNYFQSHPIIW